MKKTLLLCLAVATCFGSAMADAKTPTIYEDGCFQRFSSNGRYLLSETNCVITVYDLVEGTDVKYGDGYDVAYSLGQGNCITADGSIILGSDGYASTALYLKDGEWHELSVPDAEKSNLSCGITPDGSRICGSIGLNEITLEDGIIMMVPAYWDRNADGTYGEYHTLPYPVKDFLGEVPQYITAMSIADDGKTILGQMVFGNGAMTVPVIYTEDDKGEWSYSLPTKDLFNPNKIEPVENPGEGPAGPNITDYMTKEEYDAWDAAFEAWIPGETAYPSMEDYMSEENRAAYDAAQQEYSIAMAAWSELSDKYFEYLDAVLADSPNFVFNNVLISTDNKSMVGSLEFEDPNADPWSWFKTSLYAPCVIDIATGEMTKIETPETCLASGVADNGVIFGYNTQRSTPMRGCIIQDGVVTDIEEYIASINPSYGEWIKENMTHLVAVDYDPDTWEEIFEEMTFTGMPVSTPDISKLAFWNNCPWSWDYYAEGVVFEFDKVPTGMSNIAAEKGALKFANGTLQVPAGFVSVDIYNIGGACVKAVNKPAGAVKLDLSKGAYIVKGTRADGSVSVLKIAK